MFTSRAEYRMNLRHDSADLRLAPHGRAIGLLSDHRLERLEAKRDGIDELKELLSKRSISKDDSANSKKLESHLGKRFYQALKSPELKIEDMLVLPELAKVPRSWLLTAELDIKYEGYIARQMREIDRFHRTERMRIPEKFDYDGLRGISAEAREKLKLVKPGSIGQASRISGIRGPDVALLMIAIGQAR